MQTDWIHVEFWFKTKYWNRSNATLSYSSQKYFEALLGIILMKCIPYYKRKFYLYEPNPHCFLALELKDRKLFDKIKTQVDFVKQAYFSKYDFFEKISLKRDTGDGGNNVGFIKILDAMADYQLIYQDNSLSHIIHCMVDTAGLTREEENKLYKLMAQHYK